MQALTLGALYISLASAAAGRIIIDQGFEKERFPPPHWRIGASKPPYTNWTSEYAGGNWYACGHVGGANTQGGAVLITKKFDIAECARITFQFDFKTNKTGYCLDERWRISLINERYFRRTIWSEELKAWTWKKFKRTLPVDITPGDGFAVEWTVSGWTYDYESRIELAIDNVKVVETNTAVEPTSLGRVKALYR
jgi:hypothetical protein